MQPGCERFVPLILRSAEGTLPASEQAALDAHVTACPECRAALGEQTAVRRVLGAVELPPGPRDFAARVRQRVAPETAGLIDLFNWRAWTLRLAPVAALLALLAWYPVGAGSTASSSTASSTGETLHGALDEWAGGQAQVAGGVLLSNSSDRDALLAAALEETSR